MTVTVEFGELPPSNRGRRSTVIVPIIEALQERPGEWARVWTTTKSQTSISQTVARLKKRGAEATSRKTETGAEVWARWPEANA